MIDYSIQNKKAWEYNAYEFWVKQSGTPVDRAKRDLENPMGMLKRYRESLLLWRVNSKIAIKLEFQLCSDFDSKIVHHFVHTIFPVSIC